MPKIVDHQERREEILERSFELFARTGYGKVTMREMARHLKVSTGTLYHYFEDKDSLFQQMFRHMSRQDVQRAMADISMEMTPEDRMVHLFDFLQGNEAHFQHLLLMAIDYYRHRTDDASRLFLTDTADHYREAIRDQLALEQHGIEDLDSLLFSLILGLLIQRLFAPEKVSIQNHVGFLEFIATVLAARQP